MPIIRVEQLSKRYTIYPSPRARLAEWVSLGRVMRHSEFWSLRDISFTVERGQCVGIIGPNGAGKSTLLKILSSVSRPTSGSFQLSGRVLSLLELGTGFMPEWTGRQNLIQTASLLGISSSDLLARLPEIIEFADLGPFFDRPLRTYSSGMVVRLAFSAFTHLEPDIFILDEALAVGDLGFQRKCYRRLESMLQRGVTCLMVTHDLPAVVRFCHRAMVLNHGQQIFDGDPRTACNVLSKIFFGQAEAASQTDYGDGSAQITALWFENSAGDRIACAGSGQTVVFCYEAQFQVEANEPVCGAHIKTLHGVEVMLASTDYLGQRLGTFAPGERATFRWELRLNLNPGSYFFGCGIKHAHREAFMCRRVDAVKFPIADVQRVGGLIDPVASLQVQRHAILPGP